MSKNPKVSERGAKTLVTPAEHRGPLNGKTLDQRRGYLKENKLNFRAGKAREAIEKIREEFPDPKEADKRVKYAVNMARDNGRGKRFKNNEYVITPEDLEGLRKNKELIQKISDLQDEVYSSTGAAKDKAIQKYFDFMQKTKNDKYIYNASEGQIDLFLALVPDGTYNRMQVAGKEARLKQLTWGTSKPSTSAIAIPRSEVVETLARGQSSVHVIAKKANAYSIGREYLNTGGLDFYTGVKRNINDLDLEHVIARPENEVIWDSIPNRVLTHIPLNSKKTDLPVSVLLESNGRPAIWGGGKAGKEVGVKKAKTSLSTDIQSGNVKLSEALDEIKKLDSRDRKELYPDVISKVLGPTAGLADTKTASIGLRPANSTTLKSWGPFGTSRESPGWVSKEVNGEKITPPILGERIATTLVKWEEAGDVGKIQNFKNAKDNLWQELLSINQKTVPGTNELVSKSLAAAETPAFEFIKDQIAEIMENRVPELLKLLEG
jgi:hypothetical protein